VKNSYRSLQGGASEEIKAILGRDEPTNNAMGIRVMVRNAEAAVTAYPEGPTRAALDAFLNSVRDNYTDVNVRIGNEVILTAGHFA
jgi:hypothetical protein